MNHFIELDSSITLEQLQRALAAHGMTVMTNQKNKRQRLVRIPSFLQTDEVIYQAERVVAHLPRRNNQIVEPLHHHAYPRGRGVADFVAKQRRTKA